MAEIIFHGSNVEVAEPKILQNGFYKDFDYGFYCTKYKKTGKALGYFKKRRICFELVFLSAR